MAPTKWCMYTCNAISPALLRDKDCLRRVSARALSITEPVSQSNVSVTLTIHRNGYEIMKGCPPSSQSKARLDR